MNRRQFFKHLSLGTLASSIPVIMAACSQFSSSQNQTQTSESNSEPISKVRSDGFVEVGTAEELQRSGQLLDMKHELIVIRNPNTQQLIAFDYKCPHQGCPVGWEPTSKSLLCPCHGSRFNTEGDIIEGPALKPLKSYLARIENQSVFVKIA